MRISQIWCERGLPLKGVPAFDQNQELKVRWAQEDTSVPAADNGYVYERRFVKGAQYPLIVRRKDTPGAEEERVLDVGALAAGHPHQYQLGSWTICRLQVHHKLEVRRALDRQIGWLCSLQ